MNNRVSCFVAACLLLVLTTAVACGRKTLPQVPDSPRPEVIQGIKVMTRDTAAFLSWPIPARNVEGRDIASADIRQFRIYRAEIGRDSKKGRYKLYAEINMADPSPAEVRNNRVFWSDRNLKYGQVYSYQVRAVSVRGGVSPVSDDVRAAPLLSLAVPQGLAAQANDSSIQLSWAPVTTRMDGSHYEGFVGYNLYRGTEKSRSDELPLNKEPLRTTSFKDTTVSNDTTYYYMVRSVDSPALPWRESLDSEEVSATPRDMDAAGQAHGPHGRARRWQGVPHLEREQGAGPCRIQRVPLDQKRQGLCEAYGQGPHPNHILGRKSETGCRLLLYYHRRGQGWK